MGRALHVDCPQALVAADPMIDMNHKIAKRQGRDIGDEISVCSPPARFADQPLTQNVLFRNYGEIRRFKSALQPQNGERDGPGREALRVGPGVGRSHGANSMIVE